MKGMYTEPDSKGSLPVRVGVGKAGYSSTEGNIRLLFVSLFKIQKMDDFLSVSGWC